MLDLCRLFIRNINFGLFISGCIIFGPVRHLPSAEYVLASLRPSTADGQWRDRLNNIITPSLNTLDGQVADRPGNLRLFDLSQGIKPRPELVAGEEKP